MEKLNDLNVRLKKQKLEGWDAFYKSYTEYFKPFPECDDGAYAEVNSVATVYLLAKEWYRLGRFYEIHKTDRGFWIFVLRHIDATVELNDLSMIVENSMKKCPKGRRQFCDAINKNALDAYQEALNLPQ
jgi:hypothetical protein